MSINIGVVIVTFGLVRGFEESALSKILHVQGHGYSPRYKNMPQLLSKPTKDSSGSDKNPIMNFINNPEILKLFQALHLTSHNREPELVRLVEEFAIYGGMMQNSKTEGLIIKGVKEDDLKYLLSEHLVAGNINLSITNNLYPIVIGYRLAQRYRFSVGSRTDLYLKVGDDLEIIPCQIQGIFDLGFAEFDSSCIFTSQAFILDHLPNITSHAIIYIDQPNKIEEYIRGVENIDSAIYIESWKVRNRLISEMLKSNLRIVYVLMGFFIFSGLIQCLSSLCVLIIDRRYDMSVLTMLGMTSWQKYSIFFTYAVLVSLTNVIIGVIFGLILTYLYPHFKWIYKNITGFDLIHRDCFWVSDFDIKLFPEDILLIICCSFGIILLGMLIASYFFAKTDVVQGIRE